MPSPRYNFFCIEGTLEFTLPDSFRALLRLFSFRSFFSFFNSITVLNTPFVYFAAFSPTPTPTILNCCIC